MCIRDSRTTATCGRSGGHAPEETRVEQVDGCVKRMRFESCVYTEANDVGENAFFKWSAIGENAFFEWSAATQSLALHAVCDD